MVRADQLNWSLPLWGGHRLSDGTTPVPAGTVFQLGVFVDSFVPGAGNETGWAANWRAADFTPYEMDLAGFGGNYVPGENSAPFTVGRQMYVWGVFIKPDGSSEQWLGTAATWTVPSAANQPGSVTSIDIDDATTILLGSANSGAGSIQLAAVTAGGQLPLIDGEAWRQNYFAAVEIAHASVGAWDADPDGDGLTNALEFLMGTQPRDGASRGSVELVPHTGGLLLSCPGWAGAAVNARVEKSGTLRPPWSVLAAASAFNPASARWEWVIPVTQARGFFRVAVTIPVMP